MYDFKLDPLKGEYNKVVDAPSRRADYLGVLVTEFGISDVVNRSMVEAYGEDTVMLEIIRKLEAKDEATSDEFMLVDGLLFLEKAGNKRLCVLYKESLSSLFLGECHDATTHFGYKKPATNLVQKFWWPTMMDDATTYVETCHVCQRDKPRMQAPVGLIKPLPIPIGPGLSAYMDFMDTLVTSKSGKRHIFLIVDTFNKYARPIAMPETARTDHVIKLFMDNKVCDFGLPKPIVSDKDVRFTSELWQNTAQQGDTQLQMTSGNHPKSNGPAEQMNRVVQHLLRHYIKPSQDDWDEKLPLIASLYNDVVHNTTVGVQESRKLGSRGVVLAGKKWRLLAQTVDDRENVVILEAVAGEQAGDVHSNGEAEFRGIGNEQFEAEWNGSWWDVDVLDRMGEKVLIHYHEYSDACDEFVDISRLRMRSRMLESNHCRQVKRGKTVLVFAEHPETRHSLAGPGWYEGVVHRLDRRPHGKGNRCKCKFHVGLCHLGRIQEDYNTCSPLARKENATIEGVVNHMAFLQAPCAAKVEALVYSRLDGDYSRIPSCPRGHRSWSHDIWSAKENHLCCELRPGGSLLSADPSEEGGKSSNEMWKRESANGIQMDRSASTVRIRKGRSSTITDTAASRMKSISSSVEHTVRRSERIQAIQFWKEMEKEVVHNHNNDSEVGKDIERIANGAAVAGAHAEIMSRLKELEISENRHLTDQPSDETDDAEEEGEMEWGGNGDDLWKDDLGDAEVNQVAENFEEGSGAAAVFLKENGNDVDDDEGHDSDGDEEEEGVESMEEEEGVEAMEEEEVEAMVEEEEKDCGFSVPSEKQHQEMAKQHQELENFRRAVRNDKDLHEGATRALEQDLEQALQRPDTGEPSNAAPTCLLGKQVDHVLAMLGDISTFAAPATISEQLGTLQIELRQLHQPPDNDRSTSASKLLMSSGRHPGINGQIEQMNKILQQVLHMYIRPDQVNWDEMLPKVVSAYNNSVHLSTCRTPNKLHKSFRPRRPFEGLNQDQIHRLPPDTREFAIQHEKELATVIEKLRKAQHRMVEQANKHRRPSQFQVGDLVWVKSKEFAPEENISQKLLPAYRGPWPVLEVKGG
ncbi:hypothetical protein CBR_g28035 [Chara braunii]|uniref:Integrase catalytic domain-containing protein n=1 Tax=Chara braunii TaxID=69332 RepID=A0A388L924_CHABU|nr:hypothetical protein CBR_g28035 [Chara braunii]|eukprot:GBG78811.1 hypothetical protein CBR_g28035 [Chara braunii]